MSFDFKKLLPSDDRPELLCGPFETYKVIVEGRAIPRLSGYYEGDKIWLVVDDRFAAGFEPDDARQAAWLLANALAVGSGYSHLAASNKGYPFAPLSFGIVRPDRGE